MTRNDRRFAIRTALAVGLLTLSSTGFAWAGDRLEALDTSGVEVTRDAATLTDELRVRPVDDPDSVDTALVFTNFSNEASRVLCVGFGKNGRIVGRAWTGLPGLGLRYILASDISNGVDFVGHVQCGTRRDVRASAVLLGPDITDLPAIQGTRKRFPVVAHY